MSRAREAANWIATGVTGAEIDKLDGFTGTVDDLNYAKDLRATGVTNTEFDYLDGVGSNLQTQLNAKQATITTGISNTNVLVANANLADDDFLRVDGTSIEGRSASEMITDLGINGVLNSNIYATTNISSAANQTTVKITADKLTVLNSSNEMKVLTSVDVSPAITASGANGLDTGAEANSTWYYFYVIYNGTTTAGLLSASNSSPTMPSGYTYKKFIGAIYNYSDGHFVELYQKGGKAYSWYGTTQGHNNIFNGSDVIANTQHSVNPTAFIPPNADFYTFRFQGDTPSSSSVNIKFNSGSFIRANTTSSGHHIANTQNYIYTNSNSSTQTGGTHTLPMITAQQFYVNPIYEVDTVNLYHVGHEFLGVE